MRQWHQSTTDWCLEVDNQILGQAGVFSQFFTNAVIAFKVLVPGLFQFVNDLSVHLFIQLNLALKAQDTQKNQNCRNDEHHELEDPRTVSSNVGCRSTRDHAGSSSRHPNDTTSNGTTELVQQWTNGKRNGFVTVTKL